MSKANPPDRRYSRDHEWVLDAGDGTVTLGITDHAQTLLTDIVYVELPAPGKRVSAGDPLAVVESVKSVSDVFSPLGGEVVEVNEELEVHPELINTDAFGAGWIARLRMDDPGELASLMDASVYDAMIAAEGS
jgi:glycine cleavage system H protein